MYVHISDLSFIAFKYLTDVVFTDDISAVSNKHGVTVDFQLCPIYKIETSARIHGLIIRNMYTNKSIVIGNNMFSALSIY